AALPDLSGVVFDGLDMTKCDMNHVIFSHHSQNGKLCASFRRATFDPELSFSKGHRAVLKDLKIAAFYELDKNYLLSVDGSGYAVLTDLSLNLTVSTLSLKKTPNRYCTSNIVQDRKGTVWVACGDELFGLAFDKGNGRLSIYSTRPLPTRAVKQLVIGRDGRLYYHPHTCPLDRFRMDGTPVWAPSGLWFTNSIVNRAGDTAYCFYPDDKRSLGHVSRLVRYKRNENGWCVDGTVLTNDMLGRLTNQDYYKNPVLAFSENEKTLLLSLYCKQNLNSDDAESASAGKTVAIEIDCDSIQGNLKHYSVMDRGQIVCTAYYGSNDRKFFASYLTICFVNKHCENHRLRTGTGLLTDAIFMPDTKSFLAITNNPIRIQEMGCETPSEYRCVRQIVPAFFRAKKVSSFAFKFENGLQFTKPGALGYAEHRKQLRLVLWHDDEKNIIADLSEGIETDESLSELNLIRTPVQAIVSPGQESYCLSIRGESILLNPARQSVQPILKIEVHSEWLFADCDFTDAVFSNGELPASLRHYFGLDSNADARASQTADLKKNSDKDDDEWTDLFYVDPFGDEDTEEDYCDE
ncbi:MAG: hypothetical protein IKW24_01540, partial [Clostridia bacterium]|nr:hypothetical protein [Clostridia bacterium]